MKSKGFLFLLMLIILVFAVLCERSFDLSDSADPKTLLEDRLEVYSDEA